jgi:hypothetical protein
VIDTVEYRDIPGFPGYRVGSDGSVWSCRNKHGDLQDEWHRLTPRPRVTGHPPRKGRYLQVLIAPSPGARPRNLSVHRLVLLAFIGPCPPGHETCHGDDDPENNALSNLRWGTKKNNRDDAVRRGTWPRGQDKPNARLTEADVVFIHRLHEEGWRVCELARRFSIHSTSIIRILSGKKWAHVYAKLHPVACEICGGAGGSRVGDLDSDGCACRGCGR